MWLQLVDVMVEGMSDDVLHALQVISPLHSLYQLLVSETVRGHGVGWSRILLFQNGVLLLRNGDLLRGIDRGGTGALSQCGGGVPRADMEAGCLQSEAQSIDSFLLIRELFTRQDLPLRVIFAVRVTKVIGGDPPGCGSCYSSRRRASHVAGTVAAGARLA